MEAVLDHLRGTDIHNNIYYDTSKELVSNIDDKLDAHGMIKQEAARRKLYGIYTQGKSREQMFSLLEGHIREHKDKFIGKYIISDIMSLVRTKNGKIVAGNGYHDDNIMSYNMCLYLYYYGNNLQRFGFVRGKLPDEKDRNQGMTYADAFASLSENDKKYFEGVYNAPSESFNDIDTESMIENNRGLISSRELSDDDKKSFLKSIKSKEKSEQNFTFTKEIKECPRCKSMHFKKNGTRSNGKQSFLCLDCNKSFVTSKFSVTFASPPVARTALSSSSVLTSTVSANTIEGKIIAKAINKVKENYKKGGISL